MEKKRDLIIGALVGDAASLGLHWLYDQTRIAELAGTAPEFYAVTAKDYEGVPAYFAHPLKQPGDLTQYGEQIMVLLRALAASDGHYDQVAYNAEFMAHFGYGGTYTGYIDHATRKTLNHLADGETNAPCGAEDVQLPAIAKLPALVAVGLEKHAMDAVRTTNATEIAEMYGTVATAMLVAARDGGSATDIADAALHSADPKVMPRLEQARKATGRTNPDLTRELGMDCELNNGVPSALHNLLTTGSYEEAIRTNILSGGDSCGRAILLGALAGAVYGVPQNWADRVNNKSTVMDLLARLNI